MNYENLYVNLLIKHGTEEKPIGYSEHHHIIQLFLGIVKVINIQSTLMSNGYT